MLWLPTLEDAADGEWWAGYSSVLGKWCGREDILLLRCMAAASARETVSPPFMTSR